MVQPLAENVPAICLSCLDKFDVELVLKHWNYISCEQKRDTNLLSIGVEEDSRELKAMQVSTQLLSFVGSLSSLSPSCHYCHYPVIIVTIQ